MTIAEGKEASGKGSGLQLGVTIVFQFPSFNFALEWQRGRLYFSVYLRICFAFKVSILVYSGYLPW